MSYAPVLCLLPMKLSESLLREIVVGLDDAIAYILVGSVFVLVAVAAITAAISLGLWLL